MQVAVQFGVTRLRYGRLDPGQRALWLHRACAMILGRIGVAVERRGSRPGQGLVVANHLSYLDIAVFAAVMPCVFVSKREVRRWPGIGLLARFGGTIFIDRQSRSGTDRAAEQIRNALRSGVTVLLFPEGTSTDGGRVLRFHPSLLQPAIDLGAEITPAAIGYRVEGGEERDLCYFGDIRFFPHLVKSLGRKGIEAEVEFHPDRLTYGERKPAAMDLREKVVAMRRLMMRGRERAEEAYRS